MKKQTIRKEIKKMRKTNFDSNEAELISLVDNTELREVSDNCSDWKSTFDSEMGTALKQFEMEYGLKRS